MFSLVMLWDIHRKFDGRSFILRNYRPVILFTSPPVSSIGAELAAQDHSYHGEYHDSEKDH
jgi:hypothetical protein